MAKKERFLSLDVFRGMTVALMILVNNPGSWDHIYPALEHAKWNGFLGADFVFPFFLFAMGNAFAFVMPGLREKGTAFFLKKVLKRSVIIFLIGLGLNWLPFFKWQEDQLVFRAWEEVRIMGVLQRIAIAYLFSALIIYFFKNRGAMLTSALILIVYTWFCVRYDAVNPESAFGAGIDKLILGENHMYKGEGYPFDPEGLVTTIPTIVQVIFGYFAGWFIINKGKNLRMIRQLLLMGIGITILGLLWAEVSPLNKKIWSSSYVVFSTGLACVLISILIYLIEIKDFKGFLTRFFDAFGKNPLFIFVLSGVIPRLQSLIRIEDKMVDGKMTYKTPFRAFYESVCQPLFENEKNASLMYALIFIFVMWLIAEYMNRRKIYVKV